MRIFLYEYVTGGGLLDTPAETAELSALFDEGQAMIAALAEDFAALAGVEVHIVQDARLTVELTQAARVQRVANAAARDRALDAGAREAEWTVLIAPECGGILATLADRVARCGGRLLGPSIPLIQLAGDKQATIEHLRRAGVPTPRGVVWPPGEPPPPHLAWPRVVKPLGGAGSQGVQRLRTEADAAAWQRPPCSVRLEEYISGLPASVSFLCGPRGAVSLPPCEQVLSDDDRFEYLGGRLPLARELAERATSLARRAMETLDAPLGYMGVDLVLGDEATGQRDVVIEINPRLTTSYVGLRAASQVNLALAMLGVAEGREVALSFVTDQVAFSANGAFAKLGG